MATGGSGGTKRAASGARPKRIEINREFASLERMTEYISNVSLSGAFIRARDPWPVGTRLNLKFTVVVEDPETLEGTGEVVRVSNRPSGMGIKFVQLTDASKKLIDELLAHRLGRR